MKCLECGSVSERLDNEHLLQCSGMTVQEYGIRHRLPLDMILHSDQVNLTDTVEDYSPAVSNPTESARATLLGLRWAGLLHASGDFVDVPGEIRRLDLLLWDLERVSEYGFRFRQDYEYTADTHRVVARNRLRAPARNLRLGQGWSSMAPPPGFLDTFAVYVAHQAEWHGGYLFMQFPQSAHARDVRETLLRKYEIHCKVLDVPDQPGGMLLRTLGLTDGERLLALLAEHLRTMPTAWERFYQRTPIATVSKELVFDAAHFITDHPAKCSNLHGGRYQLHVAVTGRIDPITGCVVDYGYLKRVVNRQVVDRFDHHNLNYVATELAWRSSTEMLCAHIWECLIDYLPGLSNLCLYETTQSWCDYRGPSLAESQAQGSTPLLHPFAEIGDPARRRRLLLSEKTALRAVAGHEVS